MARTLCCAQAGASHLLPLNVVAEGTGTVPWDTPTAQGHLLCQGTASPTGSETGSPGAYACLYDLCPLPTFSFLTGPETLSKEENTLNKRKGCTPALL